MDLKSYIQSLKSRWVLLAQGAAFISLTIAGFVSPPSYFDPISSSLETRRLAVFISSLIVAIFFYLGHQFSLKKNARAWVVVTVLLALMLIASFQLFAEAKPQCICRVVGENVGIGTDYTDLGKRDAQKHPGGLPCDESLMNFGGRVERIWTAESIESCRRKLRLLYLTTYSTAALSMLSALQIVRCYKAGK
jgi:hypothetical protein